ncbi:MAG: hypothetical protein WA581_09765 [Candidatus Acidiferrales bacterium]
MAMKLLVGTAILCMLATAPVYARQNHDDKQQEAPKAPEKSAKPAEKPASKPPKSSERPAAKTESMPRHQENQQHQQQARRTEEKTQPKQAKVQPKKQPAERQATNRSHEQNRNQGHVQTAANRPGGNEGGRRIPEDRYRADFGRAHTFHVRYENDHRFQFGGFWFQYTTAWPSEWAYDDNLYIVEIDGVDYLCDARFPDQRIVVVIAS